MINYTSAILGENMVLSTVADLSMLRLSELAKESSCPLNHFTNINPDVIEIASPPNPKMNLPSTITRSEENADPP
jgi:hypothetical protein